MRPVQEFLELIHASSKDYLKEEGLTEKERNVLENMRVQSEYGLEKPDKFWFSLKGSPES